MKELPGFVKIARKAGYKVGGGSNGGGWIRTAVACGMEGGGKAAAETYLRKKFAIGSVVHPVTASESKIKEVQCQVNVSKQRPAYRDDVMSDVFLESYEWRRVRMVVLKKYGPVCQCCGATPQTGAVMNVDHIKPRRLFPQLALDVDNLQVLCHECNHGKGNWDMTDWRSPYAEMSEQDIANLRFLKSI